MQETERASNNGYWPRVWSLTKWGFSVGAVFAVCAVVLAGLSGSLILVSKGREFNAIALAVMYLAGGALAGSIVGLLFPLVRSWAGSAVLGIIAILPLMLGAVILIATQTGGWSSSHTLTLVIGAVCLGGALGPIVRDIFLEEINAESGKKIRR